MIPNVGGTELIVVLVIILLLFGAKRIPELAKGLGSGVREFRKGLSGEVEEKKDEELTTGTGKAGEDGARAGQAERSEQKH